MTGYPGPTRTRAKTQRARYVGLHARRLRRERGWSQADLAAAVTAAGYPMSQAIVGRIEFGRTASGGRQAVTVDELVGLATALGVEPAHLLTPTECDTCHGRQSAGLTCRTCGRRGDAWENDSDYGGSEV